jgi:N-methylhydantoinase B
VELSPILLEVFKNRYASIAEEMGVALQRTGFSPNIKERRDFSCALFDAKGDMIAQAEHIPVHLGSMPLSVRAAMESAEFRPGDMIMLNNPFQGGTHLPDITLVAPVFAPGARRPAFHVANRAHHADVGGMSPGSMPISTSIFQEGIIIPPVKIVEGGEVNRELMRFFLANVRTPQEREGDFAAQMMANLTGARRLAALIESHGLDVCHAYASALLDYAERITRQAIAAMPGGVYRFEDALDDDGQGNTDIRIALTLSIEGDSATLDFSESGPQTRGSVNAVRAIALSAALYVFRCLIPGHIPTNAGILRPLTVITKPGTIVDALHPAAVAAGNVECSQRIVDVILGALAKAAPERIPAASEGTMNNLTVGGFDPSRGRAFSYYETMGGGMGGSAAGPGASGVQSHMTNTMNTPVEALEYAYPFLVRRYALRKGSGGKGLHPGGDGLIREIMLTAEAEATVLSERRGRGPYGLGGGEPGRPGVNVVSAEGGERALGGKFSARLRPGDAIRIETPGGGGWGKA